MSAVDVWALRPLVYDDFTTGDDQCLAFDINGPDRELFNLCCRPKGHTGPHANDRFEWDQEEETRKRRRDYLFGDGFRRTVGDIIDPSALGTLSVYPGGTTTGWSGGTVITGHVHNWAPGAGRRVCPGCGAVR